MQTHCLAETGSLVEWRALGRPKGRHALQAAEKTVIEHKLDMDEFIAGVALKTTAVGQICSMQLLIEEI